MTRYGVRADDSTPAGWHLTVWSGGFMSTYEARGWARDGARRITLTTYNDDKVVVTLPDDVTFPRTIENYDAIDAAISAALNAYEKARGSWQMIPDLPPGDDGRPLTDDTPAPGLDERHYADDYADKEAER